MAAQAKKKFDCVDMKRRGALRIYRQTKNLTPAEKLDYWQRKDRELLAEQAALKVRPHRVKRLKSK
jgi:hypothetical protein